METSMLAAVRAADRDTLYSLYFPGVPAASVVGCVCLDYLTCSECERILGQSFVAIERAVRKKQRRDPPVPVARVEVEIGQGLGLGLGASSHGVKGSDAVAISGMADQLGPGSDPPSDGIEGADASAGTADRLVPGSHPPADGVQGSDAAISGTADLDGPGSHPPADGVQGSDASISGTADLDGPGSHPPADGVEGSEAAISGTADLDGPGSHPPADGVEGSDAAISGTADRLGPGSHPASDVLERSDAAISSIADRLAPGSRGGAEGFEATISGMAARLGLTAAVAERAEEVFRKMEEARAWKHGPGRTKFKSECPLAYAACLSVACRNEGSARSLRELALAMSNGGGGGAASRSEIARLTAHIRRRLGEEEAGQGTGIGMVCASSHVRRFGALLGLGEAEKAAALEAARRVEEGVLDVRHNPGSVAAAVVCVALEHVGARKTSVKDVAAATGVSAVTINTVCNKLRPHAELLFG